MRRPPWQAADREALDCDGFNENPTGDGGDPGAVIQYAKTLPPPDAIAAGKLDEAVWITENFEDAQRDAYAGSIQAGIGPFTLTPEYQTSTKQLADRRIALAGARLANVLNAQLK